MNHSSYSAYTAAIDHSAYYIQPVPGTIYLQGDDQVDYLQRQTTNDLGLLKNDHTLRTVLTSPSARILDVLHLLIPGPALVSSFDQSGILLLTLPGHGSTTYQYLKRRIFFMDKVSLVDLSMNFFHIELIGPSSEKILNRLGFSLPFAKNKVDWIDFMDAPLAVINVGEDNLPYFLLYGLRSVEPDLITTLNAQKVPILQQQEYDILRIENGRPRSGTELNENYTPLEAGLAEAVATSKGCYTGQEVLARQITYGKVTHSLCGLRFNDAQDPGIALKIGDQPVGVLTSSTISPRFGPIGLGILKHPYHLPETELVAGNIPLTVTSLPFVD